jgi:hypothetical protein
MSMGPQDSPTIDNIYIIAGSLYFGQIQP